MKRSTTLHAGLLILFLESLQETEVIAIKPLLEQAQPSEKALDSSPVLQLQL